VTRIPAFIYLYLGISSNLHSAWHGFTTFLEHLSGEHLAGSILTMPSTCFMIALNGQCSLQGGSSQCRHWSLKRANLVSYSLPRKTSSLSSLRLTYPGILIGAREGGVLRRKAVPLLTGNLAGLASNTLRRVNQQSNSIHLDTSSHPFLISTRNALYSGIRVFASPMWGVSTFALAPGQRVANPNATASQLDESVCR